MKTLKTNRLRLRPLSIEDASTVEVLAGDFDVAKTTLHIPYPYPEGSALTFIKSILEAEKNGTVVMFAIERKEDASLIGLININLSTTHSRGELGYWIGKPYWGQGYGTEAAREMLSFSFHELNVHKVFAAAFTTNPSSWRIMEKIGLTYEGTLKEHVRRFDQFHDLAYYGLLKEQFVENQQKSSDM